MANYQDNPARRYGQSDDEVDLMDPNDESLNNLDDPLEQEQQHYEAPAPLPQPESSSSSNPLLSGNIQSSQQYLAASIPGEDRRAPRNTIDESVWQTLSRDLEAVGEKMKQVLWPKYLLGGLVQRGRGMNGAIDGPGGDSATGLGRWPDADDVLQGGMSEGLRNWDLWGPLLFCLLLSLFLSFQAQAEQRTSVFSGVFTMIWLGEAVVTLQIKLLGGKISFFQSVCIIGYTLFPLVIASLLSAFRLHWIPRIPIYISMVAWSLAAGVSILGGSGVLKHRVGLAMYPLFLFYVGIGCLCFIS